MKDAASARHFGEDVVGAGGPDEWLGFGMVGVMDRTCPVRMLSAANKVAVPLRL